MYNYKSIFNLAEKGFEKGRKEGMHEENLLWPKRCLNSDQK